MSKLSPTSGNAKNPAPAKPLWRLSYDLVEKRVNPPLTGIVHNETFADVLALATRLRRMQYRLVERTTRRMLHAWNLPAATDIRRLQEQVATLQRQVSGLPARIQAEQPAALPPSSGD